VVTTPLSGDPVVQQCQDLSSSPLRGISLVFPWPGTTETLMDSDGGVGAKWCVLDSAFLVYVSADYGAHKQILMIGTLFGTTLSVIYA
jgi:hypothetical protein